MRSSTVSVITTFGIMPNLVQEISCSIQTTLVRLFHPLIVPIKEKDQNVHIRSRNFPQ